MTSARLFFIILLLCLPHAAGASAGSPLSATEPTASTRSLVKEGKYQQQIETLLDLTLRLQREGLEDQAIQQIEPMLPLIREKGSPRQLISALNALGSLYSSFPYHVDSGSMATNKVVRSLKSEIPDKAKLLLTEALEIARKEKNGSLTSSVLNNLGNLYWLRQRYDEAARYYRESIQLTRGSNDKVGLGAALANLGRLQVSTGGAGAEPTLDESLQVWRSLPDSPEKAQAVTGIGQSFRRMAAVSHQSAHSAKAADVLEAARRCAVECGETGLISYSVGYGGGVAEEQGETIKALAMTRQALFYAQSINSPELLYQWHWQLGRILKAQGDRSGAIPEFRMAVRTMQVMRRSIKPDSAVAALSFTARVEPVFLALTDMLLQESEQVVSAEEKTALLAEVLETVEKLRTAELQDYFKDSCLGETSNGFSTSAAAQTNAAVLYLVSMPDRLELLLNLDSGIKRFSSKIDSKNLAAVVHTFTANLSSASDRYLGSSARLYDLIIRPVEEELKRGNVKHLVIVPDGILRTIPMAALYDGEQFLTAKYTLSTTQGMQLVNIAPPMENQENNVLMAGISQPVGGFPALPSVRDELNGIGSIFGGKTLLDDQFLKDSFKKEIESKPYSFVHLATHGEFAGDMHNMFILAWDGLITFDDLNNLIRVTKYRSEPLELLTLSACKTAAGDDRAVLGLAGV
ncbi:MAG: CHAT domain-containing protein, partial [Pedobacter sp.]